MYENGICILGREKHVEKIWQSVDFNESEIQDHQSDLYWKLIKSDLLLHLFLVFFSRSIIYEWLWIEK